MQLTKNFTLNEFTCSATANRKGICNEPTTAVISNLQRLCQQVLQPIRDRYGKPIVVSSGYRCPALNKAVGGVKNSDHMYGCAADIKTREDTPAANKALFGLIKQMIDEGVIEVKQLIDEYGYDWIHISFQDGRTTKRNQILHLK